MAVAKQKQRDKKKPKETRKEKPMTLSAKIACAENEKAIEMKINRQERQLKYVFIFLVVLYFINGVRGFKHKYFSLERHACTHYLLCLVSDLTIYPNSSRAPIFATQMFK